jgi:two-component system, NtrC family, sensor kinase
LQHSRKGSGHFEAVDINQMCDEYLRLAYHGYRAKDPGFMAQYATDFDPAIDNIKVQPQEMGRVLLNLVNNAFYAATQNKNAGMGEQGLVNIKTRSLPHEIEITVTDNGPGVPTDIREKIFQPFFTTKPTGKGTGLGLSLSYDIATRLHGGQLFIGDSSEKGTTFTLIIPKIMPHENSGR